MPISESTDRRSACGNGGERLLIEKIGDDRDTFGRHPLLGHHHSGNRRTIGEDTSGAFRRPND